MYYQSINQYYYHINKPMVALKCFKHSILSYKYRLNFKIVIPNYIFKLKLYF